MAESEAILFYDGVCGLCQRAVRFVLRHDRRERILLAPLQSELAQSTARRFGIDLPTTAGFAGAEQLDTLYLWLHEIDGEERLLDRSEAAIAILKILGGGWRLLAVAMQLVPKPLCDALYRVIAINRYRWLGRYDECPLPPPGLERRFAARARQ